MDSYFLIETEVIGFIYVTNKIPNTIDMTLGTKITEKFDIPEIFIAVISSLFFIFKKNQIPDIKTMKGNMLYSKLGTISDDNSMGR